MNSFKVHGDGAFLDYYVPDVALDVVAPLQAAGHADADIALLGEVLS